MAKNNKMPVIRFSGYTNVWEQCKLGECMDSFEYGLNAAAKEYDGMHKYIRITDIDDETHNFIQSNLTSPDIDFNSDVSDYKLNINDIVFARTGASVGKTYLYNPSDGDLYYAGFLIRGKVNEACDAGFIYQNTLTRDYDSFIRITSQRSGQPGVNSKEYATFRLNIPCKGEQEKISKLLNRLDKLFTLHQRKLEKLKLTKKALLQKLFPQNGSKLPELRFKGFTDAWEQRKFLDLLDAQNGIRRGPFGSALKKDSFVKKSDYVVYEQQNAIYDNYETRYFISKEKYNELIRFNIQPGDFIMSGAGTIGRISMVPDGIKKGVFNQALIRFKVNKDSINPLYFLKFMQSDMMQKQLTQANPGSAMTNLVPMDELKKWDVTIPSLEEQNRISTFINQIDAFITLHHRKLEMLKNVKKGLLQKMFV